MDRAGEAGDVATAADTVLVRAPNSLERRTRASVVVLGQGTPVVLRGTGIAVWDAFAIARSVADAAVLLAETYGATPELVQREMLPFLERLRRARALTVAGTP